MGNNRKGFSLVEMAVVLVIFGLVMASASSILTLFVNKSGAERTRRMIEANKNTLFSIAASEQNPYFQVTATDDAWADQVNAGIQFLSYPQDAYGRDFLLIFDPALSYTDSNDQLDYSPICGADHTGITVRICRSSGTLATVCDEASEYAEVRDVAFVIVSGSVNKNIQTALGGTANAVTVYYQGQDGVDEYTPDFARAEKYDDIVDWVTLPELRVKAGCDFEKFGFVDTSMPLIQDGGEYYFNLYPTGGVPFPDETDPTSGEYIFKLVEDDSFIGTSVNILVIDADETYIHIHDDEVNGAGTYEGRGTHIEFSNSIVQAANPSYRVEVSITDSAGNVVNRTLYIRRQD